MQRPSNCIHNGNLETRRYAQALPADSGMMLQNRGFSFL